MPLNDDPMFALTYRNPYALRMSTTRSEPNSGFLPDALRLLVGISVPPIDRPIGIIIAVWGERQLPPIARRESLYCETFCFSDSVICLTYFSATPLSILPPTLARSPPTLASAVHLPLHPFWIPSIANSMLRSIELCIP